MRRIRADEAPVHVHHELGARGNQPVRIGVPTRHEDDTVRGDPASLQPVGCCRETRSAEAGAFVDNREHVGWERFDELLERSIAPQLAVVWMTAWPDASHGRLHT